MNILLIQLKRIGDLILTTPAISAIRNKFPDSKITLLVSSDCRQLLPALASVDRKLIVNQLQTWIDITRGNFDYCIDFTRSDRSSLLTRLSRAKTRIAIERRKQRTTFRSRAYNTFVHAPLAQQHTADHVLKLVEPLGISGQAPPIVLRIPDASRARANELRSKHHIGRDFLVFHPGSARSEKFWEAERWAEVIDYAGKAYKLGLVITGGRSAAELAQIKKIKSRLRQPVADVSGQTDLLTLAALIGQARLLVAVDSAPMHFAAAAQVPQIDLFGPTNPFHWRPRYSTALILRGTSPVPRQDFAPNQPGVPMNQISTQAVIDAMDAVLSTPIAKGS